MKERMVVPNFSHIAHCAKKGSLNLVSFLNLQVESVEYLKENA